VTRPPDVRDGAFALNRGSTRTEPVKFSAGPCREGCEPLRVIVMACEDSLAGHNDARRKRDMTVATIRFMWSSRFSYSAPTTSGLHYAPPVVLVEGVS
jgi:hypothetical protein